MIKERILVLCIDRDDDLGKIKRSGPIIGKDANVEAATALLLKDPEETDGNAMLQAVKVYDEIRKSKEKEVELVTITGDSRMGYEADKKVTAQLEKVLSEYAADSCVFVSDGADDEEVLPLISSRIKINSKRRIIMKQAKELEQTWLVLLNKLKEPYFARLFFGIPAFVLLAFVASESLGFGWRPIIALFGAYLLVKGFGIEDSLISFAKSLILPESRAALVVYLPVIALLIISLSLSFSQYGETIAEGYTVLEAVSFSIKSVLTFVPFMIILIFIGKVFMLLQEKRKFEIIDSALYSSNGILVTFVGFMATAWIVGEAWFSEFLIAIFLCLGVAYAAIEVSRNLKMMTASGMKLENKEAITEAGAYIGKIIGIDKKNNLLFLQTPLGHKLPMRLDAIIDVTDKVIVKK